MGFRELLAWPPGPRGWLLPHRAALAWRPVEARHRADISLMAVRAACGFPSPADDYLDRPLDFNELLIQNAPATFAARAEGESMIDVGIFPGDIVVVNRALAPINRCVVLALVDGEFTIKRYHKRGARVWLQAENPAYKDIEITEETVFEVWGVVTHCIRML